jgi:predicted dehydrogenase
MQAGKPVYVEKPMGLDVAACERMGAYSKQTGVPLVIAHYRRALPLFLEVKKLIDTKAIGDIISVRIEMLKYDSGLLDPVENWRIDPSLSGGGYFYDLAPHQLDLVFYFFGKAKSYKGKAFNKANLYKAEDTVTGEIELENGIQFKGDWCFCVEKGEETDVFEITGSKGKILFPVFGHSIILTTGDKEEQIHFEPPIHNQQNFIEKIVGYLNGVGENPCSAEDALQSMRVMEAFVYGNNQL